MTTTVESRLGDLQRELENVRALAARDPEDAVQALNGAFRDVRADLQSTRAELHSISQTVNDLRSEVRRTDDMAGGGGAGAALVASAATAMARLEARMDGEFEGVGHQMEALGTLLGQVIDSVHRVEAQVIGAHPMSERVRTSAASVLDALRLNVRQRSAHRHGGPPHEIGSGGDSY